MSDTTEITQVIACLQRQILEVQAEKEANSNGMMKRPKTSADLHYYLNQQEALLTGTIDLIKSLTPTPVPVPLPVTDRDIVSELQNMVEVIKSTSGLTEPWKKQSSAALFIMMKAINYIQTLQKYAHENDDEGEKQKEVQTLRDQVAKLQSEALDAGRTIMSLENELAEEEKKCNRARKETAKQRKITELMVESIAAPQKIDRIAMLGIRRPNTKEQSLDAERNRRQLDDFMGKLPSFALKYATVEAQYAALLGEQ